MEKELKITIGTIISIALVIIFFNITGLHIITGNGSHVGYITAVEEGGLLFKTKTAYIKTDTQSSQEDSYCVIDEEVFFQLQALLRLHERVEISYFDYFINGITQCNSERGGIIESIKGIK